MKNLVQNQPDGQTSLNQIVANLSMVLEDSFGPLHIWSLKNHFPVTSILNVFEPFKIVQYLYHFILSTIYVLCCHIPLRILSFLSIFTFNICFNDIFVVPVPHMCVSLG